MTTGSDWLPSYLALVKLTTVFCVVTSLEPHRTDNDHRPGIVVAGFFPINTTAPEGDIGRGVLPAVSLAEDDINKDDSVLPNFKLKVHKNDTQVSVARVYFYRRDWPEV